MPGRDEVLGQDGVQGYEQERGQDAQEGQDGAPVLAAAEDADDRVRAERGAGDAGGGEQEHEVDVLDEQVVVFLLGVPGVVGEPGEHDVDHGVDGHDEHGLDLGDELVDADDVVGGEEAEEDHVGLRVHAGGDAGDEERGHGFEMAPDVQFFERHERNERAQAEHVEDVGPVAGEHDDHAVDVVVGCLVDEREHEDEADEFDRDAADGDVPVLFDGLVEPFHAEGREPQGGPEDEEEGFVAGQAWHELQCEQVCGEGQGGGGGEDDEEFLDGAGEFLRVVSYLGAGAYPVCGDAQQRGQGEVGDDALREGHRAHARWVEDAGHVGHRDQGEDERRRHENHVHHRIKLQRTNTCILHRILIDLFLFL